MCRELFNAISNFFVCGLLHETDAQYLVAEMTNLDEDEEDVHCGSPAGSGMVAYQGDSDVVFA